MFEKRERRAKPSSNNLTDLRIDTSSLQGELFLPGGTRPRKNSLKTRLIEMAQIQGEITSNDYKALLAINIKKHQEKNTAKSLNSLADTYESYISHLSVLSRYYYSCVQQAEKVADKRNYGQSAMSKSTELLQQVECLLALFEENSDDYIQTLEMKTQYTAFEDLIRAELVEVNKKRSVVEPNHYAQQSKMWKPAPMDSAEVSNVCDNKAGLS